MTFPPSHHLPLHAVADIPMTLDFPTTMSFAQSCNCGIACMNVCQSYPTPQLTANGTEGTASGTTMSDESNANSGLTSDGTLESPVTSAHLGVLCSPFFASVPDLSTFTAAACSHPPPSDSGSLAMVATTFTSYNPQRQSQSHNAATSAQDLARLDPFTLIPLIAPPTVASDDDEASPDVATPEFIVHLHPSVDLLASLHANLNTNEVIGLLHGRREDNEVRERKKSEGTLDGLVMIYKVWC